MSQDNRRYHPCYCEENIWWLCQEPDFAAKSCSVLFISNPSRQVAFLEQRAADAGQATVWDYHLVLLVDAGSSVEVWDLDSRLPLPVSLGRYLDATFPALPAELVELAPRFRLLSAEELLANLTSDRSHMRDAQGWRVPPPPWPPPKATGQPMNIMRFVDMEADWLGEVFDLEGLITRFTGNGDRAG